IAGDEARVGNALDPALELGVEILDAGEGASGEEGVTQVLNRAFDLAFLIATGDCAGFGSKVVVTGQFEQLGVETVEIAIALEDSALKIVVEDRARGAAERLKGKHMASKKTLEPLVEKEAGEDGA